MPITPDVLTTVANVKSVLGINDATEDVALSLLIAQVSAIVHASPGWSFFLTSNACNPVVEYLSGQGFERLLLRYRPVQAPILTGNTTAGSAVVTGLASTSGLFVNQCVQGSTLAASSFIQSVGSAQVTLNAAATSTATGTTLVFGLGVWLDSQGYWGSAPGAFGPTTQLFEGTDFALRRDEPGSNGSASRTAMLERLGGTWECQWRRDLGALSAYRGNGQGNVKVMYVAGYASVPADLEGAVIRVCARMRNSKFYGQALTSESAEGASYSLEGAKGDINQGLLAGDVAPILARYRVFSVSAG